MTRDDAVIRIQRLLGFRTDKVAEIIDALNDAQTELEREPILPWFLRNETLSNIPTVKDQETIALPSGFLREVEDDALYIFDSAADPEEQWTPLTKSDIEFLRKELPGTGKPLAYWLGKDNFFIFPTPDAVYNLRLVYYASDVVLTTNVENKWLLHAHDLMIGKAGQKIALALRDAGALAKFEEMESKARTRVYFDSEAREHEHRRYVMGGED